MTKLLEYQEKLSLIIEVDQLKDELANETFKLLSNTYDNDPYMRSKETFLNVYNQQTNRLNDVRLDPILEIYKSLLDDIIEILNESEIDGITADILIDFQNFYSLDAHIELLKEGSVLVKLSITIEDMTYYSGLKMGYDKDDFYLRSLEMYNGANSFEYFEFYENHQMVNIRYSSEASWYRYQNQVDNTFYEISQNYSEESPFFDIRWFNPETKIRTSIMQSEEITNSLEFFNDKGIYFSYVEHVEIQKIELTWELLETSGWDACYINGINNPLNGIYLNNEKIVMDAKVYALLYDTHSLVWAKYQIPKDEITNDILNLSAYGLDFNYSNLINIEYLEDTMEGVLDSIELLSVYRGIDFINDRLDEVLYQAIDPDIKP